MEILITPAQVLNLFPSTQKLREDMVSESIILLAQVKFLLPVFGRELIDEISKSSYKNYRQRYIEPAISILVRYLIMEQLVADVGVMGVQQYYNELTEVASLETVNHLGATLRSHASTLLNEAVVALDEYETLKELYQQHDSSKVLIKAGFIL